jgi:hypothetical protein
VRIAQVTALLKGLGHEPQDEYFFKAHQFESVLMVHALLVLKFLVAWLKRKKV